ncbi:MAG: type II/IV secretion system protein [Opitutaceae bacterium]|nr:type II/IV secretion system protein [Opitutaceae bacterium]
MPAANSRFVEMLSFGTPPLVPAAAVAQCGADHGLGTLEMLQALIADKALSKDQACSIWGNSIGIAYVDPLASLISDEALEKIPVEIAAKTRAIPLYVLDGVVTVAMAEPENPDLVRRIGHIVGGPVSPVFSLPCEITDAIAVHYSTEKGIEDCLNEFAKSNTLLSGNLSGEDLQRLAESTGVIQIVEAVIHFALRERATDIHVEPQEERTRIRFRVDGFLREVLTFSKQLHPAITSRIKILADLNISENRLPQDGRIVLPLGTNKANFRISVIPSQFGEKIVVRVLNITGKKDPLTIDKIMMSQTMLRPFRRLVQSPNGIIFVTGPTGSGKTTTLYAVLQELNNSGLNISTIEDPVEIQLAGVNQTQTKSEIGLDFAAMLRALLRQDPDVILLGEIRDAETAKIATEAALTGHLVLATLHTNSAPQAVVRLMEMGVAPYMVAPSVVGVLSQRLAARICEKCKEAYFPPRDVLQRYFDDDGLVDVPFYRGRGCPYCRNTGYRGRVAFHELVLITEEIRALISNGRSVQEIVVAARKVGYRPLRYDGLKKVLLGLTTIEQIDENSSFEWAV